MALLPRLRRLVLGPPPAQPGRTARQPGVPPQASAAEDRLRVRLVVNPNDERSFGQLAEIVRRRAADETATDPLAAPAEAEDARRAADLAVWSLAEELAGNPRAWFPLIELARLSVDDDREGAMRRLATAAERDPSGKALTEALQVLREAGLQVEALGLGVGHWRVREQDPAVGRQLVLAALEADRPAEARHHLDALRLHPNAPAVAALTDELEPAVARAERRVRD